MKKIAAFMLIAAILSGCVERDKERGNAVGERQSDERSKSGSGGTMSKFESGLPEGFEVPTEEVGRRILREYGAVFVARGVEVPRAVIFRDEAAVSEFQARVEVSSRKIGEFEVILQSPAMEALLIAIEEARATGKDITPRGEDSSKRDYAGTVELWGSRVEPGLKHWVTEGRLQASEADRIRRLSPFEQVPEILALEAQGIFFAKDLSKTILQSVAAPGTSQHLTMLALDIDQFNDKEVIAILNRNGWYQTVVSDLPHFTYLGMDAASLEQSGLNKVVVGGREYWVPEL